MVITWTRDTFLARVTLSTVLLDGLPFGFGCEDVDRGLDSGWALDRLVAAKVRGSTAVPTGTYQVGVRFSPKEGRNVLCLLDVPAFQFINIHVGNDEKDTEGCLLVGLARNTLTGKITKSKLAVEWLENRYLEAARRGEVSIVVSRKVPPAEAL